MKQPLLDNIKKLYSEGYNRIDIATKLGVSEWTVRKNLKGYCNRSIRLKDFHKRNDLKMTEIQVQCVLGTLLGDGSLSYRKKTDTFEYQLSHCKEQKGYIKHIANILGVKVNKYIKSKNSFSSGKQYYKISFHNKYELDKIAKLVIKNNKKIFSEEWSRLLSPQAIACWFMDDGSSYSDKRKKSTIAVRFSTESFDKRELDLLQNMLLSFNVETTLQKKHIKYNGKKRYAYIIYIKQKSVNIFMDLVEPYIISCMRYKIKRKAQ